MYGVWCSTTTTIIRYHITTNDTTRHENQTKIDDQKMIFFFIRFPFSPSLTQNTQYRSIIIIYEAARAARLFVI